MEKNENIQNEIVRGRINTIILSSLIDEDKYGYEIRKEIEVKTGGTFILKEPTLYSSLKRLEKQGFVEAYYGESTETHGGRRKYYKLTEYGRDVTNKNLNEWKYSRSLIDKLITEEKVDLQSTPPPESLQTGLTKKLPKTNLKDSPASLKDAKKQAEKPESKEFAGNFFEKPDEKFVYEVPDKKAASKVSKKAQIVPNQQSMFYQSDEQDKIDKTYKVLVDKLISTTQSHTATSENVVEVEKIEPKEQEKSYSLLPKAQSETNPFLAAAAKIKSEGFKVRIYSHEKYKNFRQFVLINKLYLFTAIFTYLTMILELLIIGLVFEPHINLGIPTYLIIAAALTALPLAGLVNFLINRQKKVKLKVDIKTLMLTGLLFFGVGLVLIIAFRLMLKRPFNNLYAMVTEFVFPAVLLLNILTCLFFYSFLARTKKFNV